AVIAADHESAAVIAAAAGRRALRLLSVGRRGEGIRLIESKIDGFAQALLLEHAGRDYRVRLPLPGTFQVDNALLAAGLVIATGGEGAQTLPAPAPPKGGQGRLALVREGRGAPRLFHYVPPTHAPGHA